MIKEEKIRKSISAIHSLLIKIKMMTVNNTSHLEMYNFIDDVEYLPQLILDQDDKTMVFEKYLEEICEKFDIPEIIKRYRE